VRRRNKELGERNSDFELVFHALHGTPDNQAFGHLRRLRECPDVESYARTLRKARLTTRNRPSDQLNDLMEYGAMFNLFPMSTQPQDQQDDNQNMFLDPVPTTDYTSPSRQPTFMIDPRLSQKTLYNSSGQRWFDSTEPHIRGLTGIQGRDLAVSGLVSYLTKDLSGPFSRLGETRWSSRTFSELIPTQRTDISDRQCRWKCQISRIDQVLSRRQRRLGGRRYCLHRSDKAGQLYPPLAASMEVFKLLKFPPLVRERAARRR
ncbi:hypothetical protein E4T44_14706, partial [Aureobasidium sp. EXF-8845]